MGVEIELWRAIGDTVTRVMPSTIALEKLFEDYIEQLPSMLGTPLLVIRRQVGKKSHGRIDILAIDVDGAIHIIEIKRGEAPPDVLAQIFSYGGWVKTLSPAEIVKLFAKYRRSGVSLEEAFVAMFHRPLPETINITRVYTIVAASLDRRVEQGVKLLAAEGVPINVALFQYFPDRGADYLARAWLVDPEGVPSSPVAAQTKADPGARLHHQFHSPRQGAAESRTAAGRDHEPFRSCLNEPHPHLGKACSWLPTGETLEHGPAALVRRQHNASLSGLDGQIEFFWHTVSTRSTWDFLPADFIFALWISWPSAEAATDLGAAALAQATFTKRLKSIATASGDWIYIRSRPGALMDAHQPLAELVPDWTHNGSNAAIYGFRRIATGRRSGAPERPPSSATDGRHSES